jgi:hypothetical protein
MNFGTIKDIFSSILVESHLNNDKKGKELYKNFLKILKENETLSTAFIVYKNIENKTIKNEVLANEYLKESISIFDKFRGDKSLPIQTKRLISLLECNGIDYKSEKTKPLHESLQKLILTKKEANNLDIIHEHKSNVVNWLLSDKEFISENEDFVRPNVEPNKFLELAVSKFNEKYSELNEEEKNILKVLRENNEEKNKTLVLDLVKETVEIINKHLENYSENVTVKSKLLETKDVVYKMAENNDSSSDKILKLYELKTNLKND